MWEDRGRYGYSWFKMEIQSGRHARHSALKETLIPWPSGKPLVWDVAVFDTLADSYVAASGRSAGAASEMAETRKSSKYTQLGQHHIFVLIAFETFGTWGIEAENVIGEIGKKIADTTGEPCSLEFL